MTNLH